MTVALQCKCTTLSQTNTL